MVGEGDEDLTVAEPFYALASLLSYRLGSFTPKHPHTKICYRAEKGIAMSTDGHEHTDEQSYDGVIDLAVQNNSHTKAFNFMAEACHGRPARILEVGCASGYFGAVLRQHGHEVWGVEASPKAAAVARTRLHRVYIGTIEEFLASRVVGEVAFDFIVFGDVLEHLVHPTQILQTCVGLLTPEGRVIASLPNVAHLAVRLMLLEGRWEYSRLGLLDSTHLRFFTRTSMLDMFSAADLLVTHMDAVRLPVESVGIAVNPELRQHVAAVVNDDEQDIFQYVLMAQKSSKVEATRCNARFLPDHAPHVLCLLPIVEWSIGNIRIRHPLEKWQQLYGGIFRIRHVSHVQQEDMQWADTVILQREADAYVVGLIQKLQQLGKRIIFDLDDLLTDVPPFLSVYSHYLRVKPYLEQALRMVDAITVSTLRLQEHMLTYNKHVYMVPNCTAMMPVAARHYDTDNNLVTLVVASSDTVRVDFIVPALRRLLDDSGLHLHLVGIGPPGKFLTDMGLPVTCYDLMPYDQFRVFLASLDNAIGLIPLDDCRFSACKSAIKFIDYALAGIPAICSAVPPYSDVVEHERTGILVPNTIEGWYTAVQQLAHAISDRQKLAAAAQDYCSRFCGLDKAAEAWHEVFTTVKSGQGEQVISPSIQWQLRRHKMRSIITQHGIRPTAYWKALRILIQQGPQGLRARLARG